VSQCHDPPVTLVNAQMPEAVNSKMLRIDGSHFHWTFTFPGKSGSWSFCDNLVNDMGGECTESEGEFTLAISSGLTYRNGGMDNDGGSYYSENICVAALYGENAADYTSKGTHLASTYDVGGGAYRHIHGIHSQKLSDVGSLDSIGFFLGGCCYTSWTRVTCQWKDYPQGNPCTDVVCPTVVCNDGSKPPIADGQCCGDLNLCPTEKRSFSIKFGGQAWAMAKSIDGGVTWTPMATVDMHTYQHPYNKHQVGTVRDVAQDGMIIKFHPIHAQLASNVGYLCPILREPCDGTCTYDPERDLNGCFNWDGARIFIHEMTINGQNQEFTSLDDLRASGWDFQCRVSQCHDPPVTLVNAQMPDAVNSKMLRIDGSHFHWTYTFPGKGGRRALDSHQDQMNGPGGSRRSLPSPQEGMNAPSGLRRLLATWKN